MEKKVFFRFLFAIILFSNVSEAVKKISSENKRDDLISAQYISAAGMRAQSERLKLISQNIANEFSTGQSAEQDPYTRKVIVFDNKYDDKLGADVVRVKKILTDKKTPYKIMHQPGHPAADERGYVKYPNVNRFVEDIDSRESNRAYEASLYSIDVAKNMLMKTLDLLR